MGSATLEQAPPASVRSAIPMDAPPFERHAHTHAHAITPADWPNRHELFGVDVSATSYDELTELLIRAARRGQPATVTHLAVHALITAVREPEFRRRVNELDIVAPDGQP